MKIYFDFDRTLFNTKVFYEDIYKKLEEYKISPQLFDKIRIESKNEGFNLFGILEKINKIKPFNNSLYVELEHIFECSSMYVFDDVEPLLKYLKEINCKLYILTKGNEEFQSVKIDNSKIDDYFEEIIITNNHKGDLDIDYNGIFVDDNMEEIESILKRNPKKVIHINRYSKDNIKDKRFLSINSLKELYDILK